jgi:two-component system response regulator YesN
MYKVLIVDDEGWVVESLKDLVEWERYGFEVVGQAANGGEALEVIRQLHPDVVFTDIRMPEINGLELIRRVKSLPDPIHFVVVSGYAEFAYAQKALSYGAVAYCLKPFDEIEIAGVLTKLAGMLGNARPTPADALQQLLDETDSDAQARLLEDLRKEGFADWIERGIVPVVAIGTGELPHPGGRVVRLKTGTAKTAYLLGEQQAEAARGKWLMSMPTDLAGIGIGETVTSWTDIQGAIESADMWAHQFFIIGKPGVYTPIPLKNTELNERMMELSSAIGDKDSKAVVSAFDRIETLFAEGSLSILHAFKVYNMSISFLFKLGRTENILYSHEQLLKSFAHVNDMMAELKALGARYLRQSDIPSLETKNQTFNAILQFVTENYRNDLSLQDLSDQFFMNPSYISQLFKKEAGETFTAYVAKLRIAFACELLENSRDSIQEIAEKIGYHDYFYFTRLFKKLIGMTPTQYRGQHP